MAIADVRETHENWYRRNTCVAVAEIDLTAEGIKEINDRRIPSSPRLPKFGGVADTSFRSDALAATGVTTNDELIITTLPPRCILNAISIVVTSGTPPGADQDINFGFDDSANGNGEFRSILVDTGAKLDIDAVGSVYRIDASSQSDSTLVIDGSRMYTGTSRKTLRMKIDGAGTSVPLLGIKMTVIVEFIEPYRHDRQTLFIPEGSQRPI